MENKLFSQEKLSDQDWDYYLQMTPKEYVDNISDSINTINRFFIDDRFLRLLYNCAKYPYQNINKNKSLCSNQILYRARIYAKADASERFSTQNSVFNGFNEEESFVPPPDKYVSAGRANPEYIRYLYASSDPLTAISEVRAKPGDYVSVAEIKLLKSIHLFNISPFAYFNWESEDSRVKRITNWYESFLFAVTDKFLKPCRDNRDYFFCQYVSEYVKNLGFDGIMFVSSMNTLGKAGNKNYTIFNYDKCQAVSSCLYKVNSVQIETNPIIAFGERENENSI